MADGIDKGTFAERLNLLFERARARGQPLTNEDVERLTNGAITANHVWRLRNGRNTNPTLETLQRLAAVFGVALDYFGGQDEAPDEAAIRRALAQPELRSLMARLGQNVLSADDTARMAQIVDIFLTKPHEKADEPDERTDSAGPAAPE